MKLSEHVKMAIANCDEFMPNKIQKYLLNEHGIEVSITEIIETQRTLGEEYQILKNIKSKILKYGKIEKLDISWSGKILTVEITDGFENKAKNIMSIFEVIKEETKNQFPQIGKSSIDTGIFSVEFKR